MKTLYPSKCGSRGFTLIEIIATLVIAAGASAMFLAFTFGFFKTSAKQVVSIENNMAFFQVMENMTSDYKAQMASTTNSTPLATFMAHVTTNASNTSYGQNYTNVTGTPCYATYTGGSEATCSTTTATNILKVQISNGTMTLTALFTQ